MNSKLDVLYGPEQISKTIDSLAQQIRQTNPRPQVAIGVLKGSFVFFADLTRALGFSLTCDFIEPSPKHPHSPPARLAPNASLKGKEVLLIDDLVAGGTTLHFVQSYLRNCGIQSLRTCVLLKKRTPLRQPVSIDHQGFEIENVPVVGYGLDREEHYRNLPYLAQLGS